MGEGNQVDNPQSAQRKIDELRQLVAQQTHVIEAQARRMERLEGEVAALKGKLEETLRALICRLSLGHAPQSSRSGLVFRLTEQ